MRFDTPRGVTLVELAVVIAVAGILAAISAPSVMNAMRRERQRNVVGAVANHMREARDQAMARGEALRVFGSHVPDGSGPGYLVTYRTSMQLPDGTWELGSTDCVDTTEDLSTDDCPAGSLCMGNKCWGRPARSCKEMSGYLDVPTAYTVANVRYIPVSTYTPPEGNTGIRWAYGSTNRVMCFSAEGSAERVSGGVIQPYASGTYSCSTEGYNIWIADRDAGAFGPVLNKMACSSTAADYEEVGGAVVRVMSNGEIGVRSPRK